MKTPKRKRLDAGSLSCMAILSFVPPEPIRLGEVVPLLIVFTGFTKGPPFRREGRNGPLSQCVDLTINVTALQRSIAFSPEPFNAFRERPINRQRLR
jgi:hypothetical protein